MKHLTILFKRTVIILVLLTVGITSIFISCNEDLKEETKDGKLYNVNFSVKTHLIDDDEGLKKQSKKKDAPEEANYFKMVIADAVSDDIVYEKTEKLIEVNGSYKMPNIRLPKGSYKVTDFSLLNAKKEDIFILPREGSEFAKFVKNPAPILFDIKEDESVNVAMEVVGTNCITCTLDKFGLAFFDITCVDCICISVGTFVFSNTSNHFEFADSKLTIVGISEAANDTIKKFDLANKYNEVAFGGSGEYKEYEFIFKKAGYDDCKHRFTIQQLEQFAKVEPLDVYLDDCTVMNDLQLIEGYSFDNGNLTGYGSNHYEAIFIGTPIAQFINNTIRFSNKLNTYLKLDNNILNGLNDFTVKAKFSIEDNNPNYIIATNDYNFAIATCKNKIHVWLGGQENYIIPSENFIFGKFYEIVVTRSKDKIAIYLDKARLADFSYTYEIPLSINHIRLGMRIDNIEKYNGAIDDISFYRGVVAP